MTDTDTGDRGDHRRTLARRVRPRPVAFVSLGPSHTNGAPAPYPTR